MFHGEGPQVVFPHPPTERIHQQKPGLTQREKKHPSLDSNNHQTKQSCFFSLKKHGNTGHFPKKPKKTTASGSQVGHGLAKLKEEWSPKMPMTMPSMPSMQPMPTVATSGALGLAFAASVPQQERETGLGNFMGFHRGFIWAMVNTHG